MIRVTASCGVFTTVSAVPVAGLNVILIVADVVTLELGDGAIGLHEMRVKASAFVAVGKLLHIARLLTTITAIPAAATVVVIVIAEMITHVIF